MSLLLEITIILRDSDIYIFMHGDVSLNEVELTWIGLGNGAMEGKLFFKKKGISRAW